jgi:hypothetical protein
MFGLASPWPTSAIILTYLDQVSGDEYRPYMSTLAVVVTVALAMHDAIAVVDHIL